CRIPSAGNYLEDSIGRVTEVVAWWVSGWRVGSGAPVPLGAVAGCESRTSVRLGGTGETISLEFRGAEGNEPENSNSPSTSNSRRVTPPWRQAVSRTRACP